VVLGGRVLRDLNCGPAARCGGECDVKAEGWDRLEGEAHGYAE